ncbi:MAG: class I adenylate-forming enzyme family protein [Miltoncostaeaceae bacterium]
MIDGGSRTCRPRPLDRVLDLGLAADPGATALIGADGDLTWAELDRQANALAAAYRARGLGSGDRIASLMPNRELLLAHYLACLRAGLVAVPLNYRYMWPEIEHALDVSEAAALVIHRERWDDVDAQALAARLPRGTIEYGGGTASPGDLEVLATDSPPRVSVPPPDPDAPAAIFFTSGSTGPSKGVTHSRATLGAMCASVADAFALTEEDIFLPGSSISHIGSFLWTFASLSVGARAIVVRSFDAHGILPLLREHRPTAMAMIPAALAALVRDHDVTADDLASLRVCRSGSDKVALELHDEFARLAGFPIDEGYGMTEVGLATLNPPQGLIKRGSIGRPIPGYALEVRDDGGIEAPPGSVGRVWIRGDSRTLGYWGNPEASEAIVSDGWLDSGDLARADDDGYLWFFGRKKQIIVHDGSNISPQEVEDALHAHPAVAIAGVVGIHDAVHGENVRAYVVTREGVSGVGAHDLIDFTRERVGYKAPEEIVFLDEMPLNPTGKVDRPGLRRMAEQHLHPHLDGAEGSGR